ncbi:MAG: tetratricopeptide repeat protein [Candidatus Hydrogenedentes bacterium]|nr:tetratricopeptide repeat protein [Candidatus Hydrogenedentota bacterium]
MKSLKLLTCANMPSWGIAALCVLVLAAGCTTPRSNPPMTETPVSKNRVLEQRSSSREVEEARRMIESGDTTVVIPRLLQLIAKYPNSDGALDARYWLGVAYQQIKSYRDAIDIFNEYLRLAPEGKYAQKSSEAVATLRDEYEQKYWTAGKLDAEIARLTAALNAEPDNLEIQLNLADKLWMRGDYENAGKLYAKVIKDHPEQVNEPNVHARVEVLPSGGYIILTPSEVQRREVESQPLMMINTAAFQSGKDLITRESLYYVVTGQAVNRSDSVLYGVQVIVTIYGFGNMVYDTNTVNIGRLNPGEIRAFSVRFSNFQNIDDIHRYECVGSFER